MKALVTLCTAVPLHPAVPSLLGPFHFAAHVACPAAVAARCSPVDCAAVPAADAKDLRSSGKLKLTQVREEL